MQIHLTLHGILRDHLPRQAKGKTTLTLPAGARVADVLQQFKLSSTVSAAVGGAQVEPDYVLKDGDDLQLFRMLGGG
ncbi:MAG: MoaD/ThiS family protein [Anaerolineae bacterium]|nr:MoaD/ThiS family protein [Anaerolineae bacterium]